MRGYILGLVMAAGLLVLATACGAQNTASSAPADVNISVRTEPEALFVGETTLIFTLTDGSGNRVGGAKLLVHGDMDHAGMTPLNGEADVSSNGEYHVPFAWSMGGGWIIRVTAQMPGGGEVSKTFDFFVEAVSSESIINRNTKTETPPEATVGDAFTLDYSVDSEPKLGNQTTVTITVMDAAGKPVTDGVVEVVANMTHEGMLPVSASGQHAENGRYVATLDWTMTGDWQVTVTVKLADGQQIKRSFDEQVAAASP